MKLTAPAYYPQFRCIADKCVHSCCIGWEIGIDRETRDFYRAMTDDFGLRLNASIVDEDDGFSLFRMGEDGRCPMLNANGLCDLITAKGEDTLCQICADHPRYRSFFADRTEIGLGMCCEAAAHLILSQEKPMKIIVLENDGKREKLPQEEREILQFRQTCIRIMQDRNLPVDMRLEDLPDQPDMPLAADETWLPVLRDLERLDPQWDDVLDTLSGDWDTIDALETAYEQFAVYLLHRHLPGAIEDGYVTGRVRLAVLGTRLLMQLCWAHQAIHGACTLADCAEYARMFSAEIEYDEDNLTWLIQLLDKEEPDGNPD